MFGTKTTRGDPAWSFLCLSAAYLAVARGGRYRDTPADSQTPYLKTVLSFLGMTDLHFVYAEGLNMAPESAARGFADAEADLAAALA
jgi:FMN-dependent NADH-azoreductase